MNYYFFVSITFYILFHVECLLCICRMFCQAKANRMLNEKALYEHLMGEAALMYGDVKQERQQRLQHASEQADLDRYVLHSIAIE